jgi:hypothetical protein
MTDTPTSEPTTAEHLLEQYDMWRSTLDRDTDDFGALTALTAIYRYAITHAADPGSELLVAALAAGEEAERNRR